MMISELQRNLSSRTGIDEQAVTKPILGGPSVRLDLNLNFFVVSRDSR